MVHQSRLLLQLLPEPALGAADRPLPADASVCRRGWKRLEADGVGLAIVAALDRRSGENPANVIVSTASSRATSPISIATPSWTSNGSSGRFAAAVCASGSSRAREMDFCSPAIDGEFGGFQVADFLSRCHLCRKKLHGKDIYMYKGEKAFCSMECRYQQIISDECQENCGPEASRPAEVSSSPYSGGKIFFPGIVVS